MTPIKQTIKHDPENGQYGNCHQAAIASVFDLKLEDVPHFGATGPDVEEFNRREVEWLRDQGYCRICLPFAGELSLETILRTIKHNSPDAIFLLGGTSRNNCHHTVVCGDGRILHDPSPTDSGIIGPCDDGYYWVTFFGAKEASLITPKCEGCEIYPADLPSRLCVGCQAYEEHQR